MVERSASPLVDDGVSNRTEAHVTWGRAWHFRRLMKRELRTEVYLLTGSELRVVRSEGAEEQPVVGPVEYTPIHSPRGGSAMWGFIFLCPRCLDLLLFPR